MKKFLKIGYLITPILILICIAAFTSGVQNEEQKAKLHDSFDEYWNNGTAELTSFELEQARYGEIHKGEAILIYVTEPFSKSKQVKLDNWQNEADREDVLKLNFVKKFNTGLYPYSTMLSVFSSVEKGRIVKLTNSIQEWCGQVFMQFNTNKNRLEYSGYSYFEAEGDKTGSFQKSYVEDELWNLIRLSPDQLPVGEIRLIPSTTFLRFNHHSVVQVMAETRLDTQLNSTFGNDSLQVYSIQYQAPEERTVKIYFTKNFPYQIMGWEDTYKDIAWNSDRKILTTVAKRKNTIRLDYWNKNQLKHQSLRKLLD